LESIVRFTERIRQAWDDLTQSRFEKHLMRELAVQQGKVERMEIAIMPLASPAGAAYVKSTKQPVAGYGHGEYQAHIAFVNKAGDVVRSDSVRNWASIVAEHEKDLKEAGEIMGDVAGPKEKLYVDGVRRQTSTAESTSTGRTTAGSASAS
jgi:hypothetical protein